MMDFKLLSRALKARWRDQVHELLAVKKAVANGGTSIDVGANKGSYLYSMARWSKAAPVYAFEPQRVLANYLRTACQNSGLTNVRIENLALSDVEGELDLYVPGDATSPGASLESSISDKTSCRKETVQVTTLDTYAHANIQAPVRAIKIDVEGHELAVVKGALQLIQRDKPLLIIECEGRHLPAGQSVASFIAFVDSLGYTSTLAMPGKGELPAKEFDPNKHQKQTGERFWDAKDYYNNFIFRPIKLTE
jgi:FkbM family methyltransferase